jgi:hypothetical protein
MKMRYIIFPIIVAGFFFILFTHQGKYVLNKGYSQAQLLWQRFLPQKVSPGQKITTAAQSTGALALAYFRKYTYTTADKSNQKLITQKILKSPLIGGFNSIQISVSPTAQDQSTFTLIKKSFDSAGTILETTTLGHYKVIKKQ